MFLLLLAVLSLADLERTPDLWWDEGWTLDVARNWVQRGHYGRYLLGEPASGGLEGHFPVVAGVAASFRLFGVGVWQGRLVGVLYTWGALALLWVLAQRLYSRRAAWMGLWVAVMMTGYPGVNPVLNGRQVLGDIPVVFYLLAGFICLLPALQAGPGLPKITLRPFLQLAGAALAWGVALETKNQAMPFWVVGLLAAAGGALLLRQWTSAGQVLLAGGAALLAARLIDYLSGQVMNVGAFPRQPIEGLSATVVWVASLAARYYALVVIVLFALPVLLGLVWGANRLLQEAWRALRGERADVGSAPVFSVRLGLLALASSWFGWYALLSNGGPRYLASPALLGSLFAGAMLVEWSGGGSFQGWLSRMRETLHMKLPGLQAAQIVLAGAMIAGYTLVGVVTFFMTWYIGNQDARLSAEYLNAHTPPGAVIETYESELFIFLDRPWHYPPDQVHGDALRRATIEPELPVQYDPLVADPDYLVVGPTGTGWQLYDQALEAGLFSPVESFGRYTIYARNRPPRG